MTATLGDPLLLAADRFRTDDLTEEQAFPLLGYEPTCIPRHEAMLAGRDPLPAPCGQCPQEQLHAATEDDVVYGGAAGGGKSMALVADDLRDGIRYPGIRIGVFRTTLDELAESIYPKLDELDYQALHARLTGSDKQGRELRFRNGSLIRYRAADSVLGASRRQGGEYQKITIDERTLMRPTVVERLRERLRSSNPRIPVIGMRSGTNPGGIGHATVKQIVEHTDYGREVWTDEHGVTHRFIPAKVDDNPHVDAGYRRVLDSIPDEKRRAAMRDGSWDSFAGQFFDEWRRDRHVVKPFTIPPTWRRIAGIDYGFAAPWAVEWVAVDPDGRAWVYRELYKTRVIEREQAAAVLGIETLLQEDVVHHADPAMWSRTGEAPSPAQAYSDADLRMIPAVNDRVPGWQRIHTYLADGPACALHRAAGLERCPMLHVFETCPALIRTLPSLIHDEKRPEDVDTHGEDHAPDALRYALMSQPNPVVERQSHYPEHPGDRIDHTSDLLHTAL
jgi:hypothetical protein